MNTSIDCTSQEIEVREVPNDERMQMLPKTLWLRHAYRRVRDLCLHAQALDPVYRRLLDLLRSLEWWVYSKRQVQAVLTAASKGALMAFTQAGRIQIAYRRDLWDASMKTQRNLYKEITRWLICLLTIAWIVGCMKAEVRIDGSSPDAFVQSHAKMMSSLSPVDRIKLEAAELMIRGAAGPKSSDGSSTPVPLSAIRGELDGKSFKEIWALGGTKKGMNVKVGFITEPQK